MITVEDMKEDSAAGKTKKVKRANHRGAQQRKWRGRPGVTAIIIPC